MTFTISFVQLTMLTDAFSSEGPMSENHLSTSARAHYSSIRDRYLEFLRDPDVRSYKENLYTVDVNGSYVVHVLARLGHGRAVLCPVTLPGVGTIRPFGRVLSGLFGDENFFVQPHWRGTESRFFTDLDNPVEGQPLFSLSHIVPQAHRLELFAIMLLYATRSDIDFLGKSHPAEIIGHYLAIEPFCKPVGGVEVFNPADAAHSECRSAIEMMIGSKWACVDGRVLRKADEPFYTIIAPDHEDGLVQITTNVEQSFTDTPFGTFAAHKWQEAMEFANLLVNIGCAKGIRQGCHIELYAPEFVSTRNHATEIAYSAWALSDSYEYKSSESIKKLDEATSAAGGFFPYWSDGTLWIDPHKSWENRVDWENRWRVVGEKLGAVTAERIAACESDVERSRLRRKPIIDFLMRDR